jgi:hypothetical protein
MRPMIKLMGPTMTEAVPTRKRVTLRIVSITLGCENRSSLLEGVALSIKLKRAYSRMLIISAEAGHAIKMIGITILFFLMTGC